MAELIDKWEVVNKLIQLQNQYNFYKNVWDAEVLYRRIAELEIGIGKTLGLEVVRCKDCKHFIQEEHGCNHFGYYSHTPWVDEVDFCSYGERKDNGI